MNIEDTIKEYESALKDKLLKDEKDKYARGIGYALGMVNKYFKNRTDCWFYGIEVYCCKKCDYICDRFQKKEEIKDENNTI